MNKWQKVIHKIILNDLQWMGDKVTYRRIKKSVKKSIKETNCKNNYKDLLFIQKGTKIFSDMIYYDKSMDYFDTEIDKIAKIEYQQEQSKMNNMYNKIIK